MSFDPAEERALRQQLIRPVHPHFIVTRLLSAGDCAFIDDLAIPRPKLRTAPKPAQKREREPVGTWRGRLGKTRQDKMPVAVRPRVMQADERRALMQQKAAAA